MKTVAILMCHTPCFISVWKFQAPKYKCYLNWKWYLAWF